MYSPCEIISGQKLDLKLHLRMDFGEYAGVHDDPSHKNVLGNVLGLDPQVISKDNKNPLI